MMDGARRSTLRKWLGLALKAGVTAGILVLIFARTDVRKIAVQISSIQLLTVAVALGLSVVQTTMTAYRWVLVMRGTRVSISFWGALQACFAGLFLNQCLPSYIGGDAYRVYWVHRGGHRLALAVRGVLIDRVSAVMALVGMLAVSLPFLFRRFDAPAVMGALLLVLAGGVGGSVAFLAADALPRAWGKWRPFRELAELSRCARGLLLRSRSGAAIGALAIVVHSLTAVIMYAFAGDMNLPLSALDCLVLVAPMMLLTAVPISIAGWGVREGVVVGALSLVGIQAEQSLALSVLLGFTLLATGLIGALPLAFGSERLRLPQAGRADGPPGSNERLA